MSLANISTILALTVATSCQASELVSLAQHCTPVGGENDKSRPCCEGLEEYSCVWSALYTCCYDRKPTLQLNDTTSKCAKEGEATYEGMPCCDPSMTSYSCWFDATMTCCYNLTFLQ